MKTSIKLLLTNRKYRKTPKGVLTNIYNKMKERRGEISYSLQEFHRFAGCSQKFRRLYNEWVDSKYKKEFKPTVDRIDYKKGYGFDNIQFLSWKENRYKQRMELKRMRGKKVYQILNGKIISVYKSQQEVIKKIGVNQGLLSEVLNKKRKRTGGYEWSYENPELLNPSGKR